MHPSNLNRLRTRSRGYLPHWELDESFYFITYRLADSLPREVSHQLAEEHARIRRIIAGDGRPTLAQHAEIGRAFGLALDRYLDRGYGACHLRNDVLAGMVAANLKHFDGSRYDLDGWCVMPNHVHVILLLHRGSDLSRVVHSWKSYTAKLASRQFGIEPPFWEPEYFDRIIRDVEDLDRTRRYVRENPQKAGLVGWKWVGG